LELTPHLGWPHCRSRWIGEATPLTPTAVIAVTNSHATLYRFWGGSWWAVEDARAARQEPPLDRVRVVFCGEAPAPLSDDDPSSDEDSEPLCGAETEMKSVLDWNSKRRDKGHEFLFSRQVGAAIRDGLSNAAMWQRGWGHSQLIKRRRLSNTTPNQGAGLHTPRKMETKETHIAEQLRWQEKKL
jgi:hypothetical protein